MTERALILTALEKKGLDRKTNHQDLTKAKIEEICVLSKAIQEEGHHVESDVDEETV